MLRIIKIKSFISPTHPIRLIWHRIKAFLACLLYRYPSRNLIVIGITGTNGKTTTVNLTAKILEKAGYKVGMASTINFKIDRKEWQNKTHKTTLGPFQLQKLLRKMVSAGCQYAVLETSSHAIAQYRIEGVSYDIACITNVTPEHLDYHKSMKAYRQEKLKLFSGLAKSFRKKGVKKISILNADDVENFNDFAKCEADEKIAYGKKIIEDHRISAQIRAEDIRCFPNSTEFLLITPKERMKLTCLLPGEFNIENVLAATTIAYSQNIPLATIQKALNEIRLIPGRLESIEEGQPFQVFIDFAMTEDGYRKLLTTLRKTTTGKLWVVFGCCGDRDRKKRPKIGEICGTLADRVVICDDEPYTEDPKIIRQMILEGISNTTMKKNQDYFEIQDREEAIRFAFQSAKSGDTVVIPGMGDFEGRTFSDGIHPWSDREVARKILKKLQNDLTSV